jgi:hypothetical protein
MDKTSPFFNIFGYSLNLGPLKELEAHELILGSPRPFAEDEVTWILEQSRLWPVILQTLCQMRLTALEMGQSASEWQAEGVRKMGRYKYLE